jgi:hypothetical protein
VRNEIDQQAVVGHVVLQIGMRPVGAPEHVIGKSQPGVFVNCVVSVI